MPQLDVYSFFHQFTYIISVFILIYITLSYIILPLVIRRNLAQKKVLDITDFFSAFSTQTFTASTFSYSWSQTLLSLVFLKSKPTIANLLFTSSNVILTKRFWYPMAQLLSHFFVSASHVFSNNNNQPQTTTPYGASFAAYQLDEILSSNSLMVSHTALLQNSVVSLVVVPAKPKFSINDYFR